MQTYNLTVADPHGLHLRVAAKIVDLVKQYGTKVRLFGADNRQAYGGSIRGLLTLELGHGNSVRVEVDGADESQVAARLSEIFGDGGGI